MVGNSGYINVQNEARNLSLSCAMSQLGVKVDGVVKSLDLYGSWDDSNITVGANAGTHSGAGFWWDNNVAAGDSVSLGSVTYGPIVLKQEPYKVTTTTETKHQQSVDRTVTEEVTTILPQYLDIQHGANAGERLPIRLYNLSAEKLKCEVGERKPISAFHASDSLDHIDRVVKKMSGIRSYYGAMQNRLEYIYDNDLNYAENLERSESVIRDTDMATEMMPHFVVFYNGNEKRPEKGKSFAQIADEIEEEEAVVKDLITKYL